ncbi:MAG: ribonuclease Y [Phycisphaerales bacterium]
MQSLLSFTLALEPLEGGIAAVLGAITGGVFAWFLFRTLTNNTLAGARAEAEQIRQTAAAEAEAEKQRVMLEAEKRATQRREAVDTELDAAREAITKDQERVARREDTLDEKLERLNRKESKIDQREERTRELEHDASTLRDETAADRQAMRDRLEQAGGLSESAAREQFLQEVREAYDREGQMTAMKIVEEAEEGARGRAREITIQAIQRFAAEHVADSTVRSVKIPSDDLKGRIIGREGRNIRTLEKMTGADILVDDTPGVISVSCFDPIRRAIAGEALTRLVADGRVHPSRIEEIVASVKKDMQESIRTAGNDAVVEADVRGLHGKIVEAMGKLHYRTSYGQNVLRHSIEVAFLSQVIADQLGLDGRLARRCGFLHDIGKAMDHDMEGGHPAIGAEFARRYGEKKEPVLNAIAGHHGDVPATSVYTPIVMAADAISGARPGARRESMEMYVKRLEQLEGIARDHGEVEEAHAFQAGREIRVIVNAEQADDSRAWEISRAIAQRVEDEMTFPGEIKVTVLREVRAESTAR